ncbi:MAG: hypothetical protein H8E53_03990, partial [Planctomycetes bacterium]|nr:hypothetical protein [Planctomycetota bacterium]
MKQLAAVLAIVLAMTALAIPSQAQGADQTKEITVANTYLLMPINNKGKRNQRISL